jgi:putative flippase GtrA
LPTRQSPRVAHATSLRVAYATSLRVAHAITLRFAHAITPNNRGLVHQSTPNRLLPGRSATMAQRLILAQFLRFGTVGMAGFVVDTTTVYSLRHALGLYGAGVVAYLTAATSNWLLNRIWTFRGRGTGPAHRQWALFMMTNLAGFVLNRGTYALLITFIAAAARQPVLATAAGAAAAMFVNFSLSRRFVFR